MAKLTARAPEYRGNCWKLLLSQSSALNIELQQRACEYLQLLQDDWDSVRAPLLERMPIFSKYASSSAPSEPAQVEKTEEVWMLDLLGDGSAPLLQSSSSVTSGALQNSSSEGLSISTDLLGGLDLTDMCVPTSVPMPSYSLGLASIENSGPSSTPGFIHSTSTPISSFQPDNLLELGIGENDFDEFQSAEPVPSVIIAFEDDEISIHLNYSKGERSADTIINCVSINKTKTEIQDYKVFSAVLRHLVLNLAAPSDTKMGPGEVINQQIKIHNTQHKVKPIVLRLKIGYNIEGNPRSKIATVDFPAGI